MQCLERDMRRSSTPLLRLAPVLLTWLCAACSLPSVDLKAKECPCAAGWVCDTASNQCFLEDGSDTRADAGMDTAQSQSLGALDADGDGVMDDEDECPLDPGKSSVGVCGCGVSDDDADWDGTPDCEDACAGDPDKIAEGVCGCGLSEGDRDGDGTVDCEDGCPDDPLKPQPGLCGCGRPDDDGDGDAMPDCTDECLGDPLKRSPGFCGCGVPDTDTDRDTTPDCFDDCERDPQKTAPGVCGCGVADTNQDGDRALDCLDDCPQDPAKTEPGVCGCGVSDADVDLDGTADCVDDCPDDTAKSAPGQCGCGVSDVDSDSDGTPDCNDDCPDDPGKTAEGACGCGAADVDTDGDGSLDCQDDCASDPGKSEPGVCGCGTPDADDDMDGTLNCLDPCPDDPDKTQPGQCGCGVPEGQCPLYSASRESPEKNEGVAQAFDGRVDTKWLGGGTSNWIQVQLPVGEVYDHYSITSANDRSERDPRDFQLLGSEDGVNFVLLDARTDELFTERFQTRDFPFANTTAYRFYRLNISNTLDAETASSTQLAEFTLRFLNLPDECPDDPYKLQPGLCGCGVSDVDTDDDGVPDCDDGCPLNDALTSPGACLCGVSENIGNVDTCVFTSRLPLIDTYVSQASPLTNFSNERGLLVDGDPTLFHALVTPADLADVPARATVRDAQLVLHIFNEGDDVSVTEVLDAWDPATVTYDSAPPPGVVLSTLPASVAVRASATVSTAVQQWVDGEPIHGLGLYSTGPNGVDIRSSEYVMPNERPYIEVRWTLVR